MSEVKHLDVTVQVTKESHEVFEAIASIIADIKAGKDVALIAAGNLPKLMVAVEGYDLLDDEVKDAQFPETVALGGAKIVKALKVKKVA